MRIVENSPSRLRLRESTGWLPLLLFGAAVVVAVVVIVRHDNPKELINVALFAVAAIFFRRESRITLDKAARRCGIFRQDMWRHSYRAVPFDDIQDVQVEIAHPDLGPIPHSRLSLLTSEGPVPLTAGFNPTLDWHIKLRETMLDVIFAGRPRPAPIDPVKLLLDAGRPYNAARRA